MTTNALSSLVDVNQNPLTAKFLSKASETKIPEGFVSPAELMGVDTELSQRQAKAQEDVNLADIGIERAKQEQKVKEQEIDVQAKKEQAKAIAGLPEAQDLKTKREEMKNLKFVPDQLTAKDLATVFSLINVIGMTIGGGGRTSAVNALAAMDGMAQGYQQGRTDLYRRQQIEFDKNFKALQQSVNTLEKEYSEAVEKTKTDSENGRLERQMALSKAGSPILKAMEQKQGVVKTLETIKQTKEAVDKAVAQINAIAKIKYETEQKNKAADLRYKRDIALKQMEQDAAKNQKTILGVSADGKTIIEADKYGNITTQESPIDLKGSFKIGAKPTAMKKGEYQSKFVSDIIGEDVDTDAAPKIVASEQYKNKLKELQKMNSQLGGTPGLKVEFADYLNKFIASKAGPNGTFDPQDLQEAYKQIQSDPKLSKSFNALSDNAKVMSKAELDAIMQNLQTKYGNRAPVAEFKATQNVLSRKSMDANSYNRVLQQEIKSTNDRLIGLGVSVPNIIKLDRHFAQNPTELELMQTIPEDAERKEEQAGPKEGDKSKSKSGRPMIFRNGEWHYEDEK